MEKCCKSTTEDVKKEEHDANQSSASDEDMEENQKQAKRPQRNVPQVELTRKNRAVISN
jgi:glutaredoxin